MDIRGIWKVKEVHVPTLDGEKVFTPDNPPEDEMFEEMAAMMQWRTECRRRYAQHAYVRAG